MLNIVIFEEDIQFAHYEKKQIENCLQEVMHDIVIYNERIVPNDLKVDLCFLNIELDEIKGFAMAEEIKKVNKKVIINVVTNYVNNAIYGYEYGIFRFIKKEDFSLKIKKIVNESLKAIYESQNFINIKYLNQVTSILVDDILYVLSMNNYLTFKTFGDHLKSRMLLREIKDFLLQKGFVQVNRGILINIKNVKTINAKQQIIYLKNGEYIKASRNGLMSVKNKIIEK